MALLRACACHRRVALRSLNLVGDVPLSVKAAEAVAAACPQLTSLSLDCASWHDCTAGAEERRQGDEQGQGQQEAARGSCCLGVVQLLSCVGPRLRQLEVLRSAHHWPAEAWGALRHCTGLTSLAVEAGWRDGPGPDSTGSHLGERQFPSRRLPLSTGLWPYQCVLTVISTCAKGPLVVGSAWLRH